MMKASKHLTLKLSKEYSKIVVQWQQWHPETYSTIHIGDTLQLPQHISPANNHLCSTAILSKQAFDWLTQLWDINSTSNIAQQNVCCVFAIAYCATYFYRKDSRIGHLYSLIYVFSFPCSAFLSHHLSPLEELLYSQSQGNAVGRQNILLST